MTDKRSSIAYEVTWLIRRTFRAMASRADQYLAESGLTAADRAVLEFLDSDGALSVPEIARRYNVSRQHIQVTANSLLDKGLLLSSSNPRHKRSRLLRLSNAGKQQFADIRAQEAQEISRSFAGVDDDSLEVTRQTLSALLQQLEQGSKE